MSEKIPDWLLAKEGMSQRQWKSRKRQELRAAIDALGKFNVGAAYTPASNVIRLLLELQNMKKQLSIKSWGQ